MPAERTVEYDPKPEWSTIIRDGIYEHVRMSWRMQASNPTDALYHLNEAISLLYLARCCDEHMSHVGGDYDH